MRFIIPAFLALTAAWASAQDLPRPKILGLAHIALYVHNFESARKFYTGLLGMEEPFGLPTMAVFKINDRQFIEVSPEKEPATDRLSHYAIQVEDAEAMRAYLAGKGVTVPATVPTGKIGNLNFDIRDPEGHAIEIVQYPVASQVTKTLGQFAPESRVSKHMRHVGFVVTKLDEEIRFYTQVLGFSEFWRGSSNGTMLSWINMKVPDGDDYVEFMLFKTDPGTERRLTANHLCLLVDDIPQTTAALIAKAATAGYAKPMEPKTGVNRKRQLNLYDADGTRTELMESVTVDGRPAVSSTAPPPA